MGRAKSESGRVDEVGFDFSSGITFDTYVDSITGLPKTSPPIAEHQRGNRLNRAIECKIERTI